MKRVTVISMLCFFTSCIKFEDFFDTDHRKLLSAYNDKDLLYFKSNNDYDTIKLIGIDSTETRENGVDNLPEKNLYLDIKHLPNNKWNFGEVLRKSTGNYDSIVNQSLISINKVQTSNNKENDLYYIYISYRDFSGELDIQKLKSKKIDTIINQKELSLKVLESYPVKEIYWSFDKGMIGYKKRNGQVYRLVEKP